MPENNCPFDILADGLVRLEVKSSQTMLKSYSVSNGHCWSFNIHRHNKLVEAGKVDFYLIFIPPIPEMGFRSGVTLVVPAKEVERHKTIMISGRSLITKWGRFHAKWNAIKSLAQSRSALLQEVVS